MSALFGGNGKTPVIGLDLGSGYIKMAQFKDEPNGLKLVNFGVLPVPDGSIVEGRVEKPKEIQDIIKELVTFHSFLGNRVVANVSGQLVVVKELLMEDLPEDELSEAIKWEMEKFLPFPIEKATFDFQVLNRVIEEKGTKLDVLVTAAPLDVVQLTVDLLKMANLEPVAIEVEPFAAIRLLNFMEDFSFSDEILLAIINIGHNYTSINMIDKGMVRFSRTLPVGGRSLTEAISSYFGKSYEESEEMKIKELDLSKTDSQIFAATKPIFDNLALEIKRSISFYFNKYNEGKTMNTAILLEGGTANVKGLEQFFESAIGVSTVINRLFTSVGTFDSNLFTKEYLHEMAPTFSVATGLALRDHQLKQKGKRKKEKGAKSPLAYKKG
ncbi:MAG: type IV pilus assembly protein PilM [Caldisericaceae bacterium]